ncbi:MAG: hypothetical protein GEV28_23030 [Actinophytocola sp.]|uniref:hypothetical protein n=1 Tax=Actinophytocola sp. TaxID=1872138 RepID=UPI00132158E5|nr:hypothetical protein [Actinophytocola sp.]MPZ83108.1 hypothetical protein [Actinophytocola sp.]
MSTLVDGGASILDVRDMVGHKSIITTTEQVYGHLFEHSHDKIRAILDGTRDTGVYPVRTQTAG